MVYLIKFKDNEKTVQMVIENIDFAQAAVYALKTDFQINPEFKAIDKSTGKKILDNRTYEENVRAYQWLDRLGL